MLQRDDPMPKPQNESPKLRPARTDCHNCRTGCLCAELERRRAYDAVRARKGLAPLFRPPSLR